MASTRDILNNDSAVICLETEEAVIINTQQHYESEDIQPQKKSDTLKECFKQQQQTHQILQNDKTGTSSNEISSKSLRASTSDNRLEHCLDSSSTRQVSQRKKNKRMYANLSGTKYSVVHEICLEMGFVIIKETDPNCYFIWNDSFILPERVLELKPYQRINHFPGMGEICRKDLLARHMIKMEKTFPEDYSFIPSTWILPAEFTLFTNHCRDLKKRRKVKTFIVKPANGAMGNGDVSMINTCLYTHDTWPHLAIDVFGKPLQLLNKIYLVKNADRIRSSDNIVVQEYIDKPMLLDGFKFDLRVYVLVTSCDPLRIFLFNDGLVRLGTECYKSPTDENINDLFMHLTNYSVNKHNENFSRDDDISKGSKRSLSFLKQWLKEHEYNVSNIWASITDIIIKTLIVSQPHVLHSYRLCRPGSNSTNPSVCFEILGFDILLDSKMKPWLLEVNRSPSFGTDSKLDYAIKSGLLRDAIKLLNIRPSDRKRGMAVAKAQSQRRLMMQPNRSGHELSDNITKKLILDKRISQLKERLHRIRHDAAKEDYELRNSGNYRSIYPPRDKLKAQYYLNLLDGAFKLISPGKTTLLQKETNAPYSTLKEEEILDLLEQCESDEQAFLENARPPLKGPKPLSSMPSAKPVEHQRDTFFEDSSDDDYCIKSTVSSQQLSETRNFFNTLNTTASKPRRPATAVQLTTTSLNKSIRRARVSRSSMTSARFYPILQDTARDEELTRRTLTLLNEMKIKFPGRTEEEASFILNHVHDNWKFHKERVANYWLVKLDSAKRRKVIDIVKTNVRSILQRVWGIMDLDRLKLSRVFTKVFNRMLWSHGQGLWNCFSMFRNSWETMFSKSTDVLTPLEMSCCRRAVSLCKECLLVVYIFAATETKQMPIEISLNTKSRSSHSLS